MRNFKYLLLLLTLGAVMSCGTKYSYETVDGDPTGTRIYTLDNGLKVYLSVNKDEPRIQTQIAVRVGGKNDPSETTGLAHYFEHLMFKGTQQFGTSNYEAEKPMLDEIESLFEVYRKTTGESERAAIYHRIDSISYEASKLSIPNEYDKLMSAIGADGTNAYTSFDVTSYVENIPSNQIENWALIQSDRFKNPILRGFHTELETIYEEKNMSLTNDGRKVSEAMLGMLYPNHPYGQQTVLGTQEHLKNPSITNVKNYHTQWYVPNNMAVCMAGDLDFDKTIAIIDKYFGDMKANPEIPELKFEPETPFTAPVNKTVLGPDAENVTVAWRIGGASSEERHIATLAGQVLSNGRAGLIDLDLNQQQKVLSAYGYASQYSDYGMFVLGGRAKAGQSLDQVAELMRDEVKKLREGDFDPLLLESAVNNAKVSFMSQMESNNGRVYAFVNSFVDGLSWEETIAELDYLGKVTKEDIMSFAGKYLGEDNYVTIYKREGKDPGEQTVAKPAITPIVTNRDVQSAFLTRIQDTEVTPIEPVFVDYDKDMVKTTAKAGIPVLYKENTTNDIFQLSYIFETGATDHPAMSSAFSYLGYLGTADKSAEDFKREFYNIATNYRASVSDRRITVSFNGLSENMSRAMELFEELVAGAIPQEDILKGIKDDVIKSRANNKMNQSANFGALRTYALYGPEYIDRRTLSNNEMKALTSAQLLDGIRELMQMEHTILYYGPMTETELLASIEKHHHTPATLAKIPARSEFKLAPTADNTVYLAQYGAQQIYYSQINNTGIAFDAANDAAVNLYNDYFGGGMNAIVFQEMREARGLAYSAYAYVGEPGISDDNYHFVAFIATQGDKMGIAVDAFDEIINDMPESEAAFTLAKESLITRLRTQRTIKSGILWSYLHNRDMGINYDRNKPIFEQVQTMTLADVTAFQQKWIKDKPYTYCVLGDIKNLDMNKLRSMGKVQHLSQEDIFGY